MRISDWSSDVCSSDLDEGLLDRFDQVFAKVFKAVATRYGTEAADIPADWLRAVAEKYLTPEEMAAIEALGSWDEIMETLKKRLEEKQGRHQGEIGRAAGRARVCQSGWISGAAGSYKKKK